MVLSAPQILLIAFAGIFGLMVGSFLNVCIYRLPRECMSLVHPRSRCTRCRQSIAAYDNIPVLSWLFLRGKCRNCSAPISIRYPGIELLTGWLFASAAYVQVGRLELTVGDHERIAMFGIHAYLLAALVAATFIDFDFKIIPDEISLAGAALAPVASLAFPFLHAVALPEGIPSPRLAALASCGVGMCVGGGMVYLFGEIGTAIFKKEAMGLGDVKLMAMIGGFFGWESVILIFVLACVLGSIFGILIFLRTRDRHVAFGPYLAVGAIVFIFFQTPILHFVHNQWLIQ